MDDLRVKAIWHGLPFLFQESLSFRKSATIKQMPSYIEPTFWANAVILEKRHRQSGLACVGLT